MIEVNKKLRDLIHAELKNNFYRMHLSGIDELIKEMQKDYPNINLDNLTVKFVEMAEKASNEMATILLKYKEEITNMALQEINSYKQIQISA